MFSTNETRQNNHTTLAPLSRLLFVTAMHAWKSAVEKKPYDEASSHQWQAAKQRGRVNKSVNEGAELHVKKKPTYLCTGNESKLILTAAFHTNFDSKIPKQYNAVVTSACLVLSSIKKLIMTVFYFLVILLGIRNTRFSEPKFCFQGRIRPRAIIPFNTQKTGCLTFH